MSKYKLEFTNEFVRSFKKITKNNIKLERKVNRALEMMMDNPFYKGLRTHKANTQEYGRKYSSRVTGDIRVVWDFIKNRTAVILLLTIGGHSGKHKVYR